MNENKQYPDTEGHVVVGSNLSNETPPGRLSNWLRRLWLLVVYNWRYRALAIVAVLVVVGGASTFAFVALRSVSEPSSVVTEGMEEGSEINPNTGRPDRITPNDTDPADGDGGQGDNDGEGNPPGSSGGNNTQGRAPGSSGGSSGGGNSGGNNGGDNGGGDNGDGNGNGDGDNNGGSNSCALPKYPTPNCTGVPAGTTLTTDNRCTLSTPGEVITGKQFNCRLDVSANNVTIKNSYLARGINNWSGGGSFTLEDSTVGPPSGCDSSLTFGIGARNYTARRVLVRGIPDGFRISNTSASETVTIEDSYYRSCSNPGDHSDGVQADGSRGNATIRHNTFDLAAASSSTSPMFWADASGSSHGRIENNLLIGGGYTIWLATGNGHIVTGNRLTGWEYGPTHSNCGTVSIWQDNRSVTIDSNYNIVSTGSLVPCS